MFTSKTRIGESHTIHVVASRDERMEQQALQHLAWHDALSAGSVGDR